MIVFLSLVILTMGNFSYAISHVDCIIDNDKHLKCEIGCCAEDDCFNEEESAAVITDKDGCCEVHIETSMEQDFSMPIVIKLPEKIKSYGLLCKEVHAVFISKYFLLITHKLKSTNIVLISSNLRI